MTVPALRVRGERAGRSPARTGLPRCAAASSAAGFASGTAPVSFVLAALPSAVRAADCGAGFGSGGVGVRELDDHWEERAATLSASSRWRSVSAAVRTRSAPASDEPLPEFSRPASSSR